MTPTDPAPRGADAPDYAAADGYAEDVDYHHVTEGYTPHIQDFAEWNLARAYLALRSPVPAEATSGAEPSEEYQRGFSDGYDTAASISVTGIEGAVDVLDALVAEGEPCEHDTGHCSCKQRQALESVRTYLAALRTPPAPLPREGATVTEKDVAMLRELVEHDACAWMPPYREAVQRILAALTLAAQPTTKTEK